MTMGKGQIWFNGAWVAWADATVHVMAHGLHYGSSVFEGIRSYATPQGPVVFRLQPHVKRLFDSAKVYRMDVPWGPSVLSDVCRQVVSRNGLAGAYIRPVVYRGAGTLGLIPTKETPVEVAVAAWEWGPYLGAEALEQGVDTAVSSWARVAPNTVPAMAKAGGNYLSSQLIGLEAKRHGYHEAIALDVHGYVSEGPGENIFLVRDGVIYTPPLTASILPGITRDAVITLARAHGYEVREENIAREALYIADELFFTGTAAELSPIRSVDGLKVGDGKRGPVTKALQDLFFGLFDGSTVDRWEWLEPVADLEAGSVEAKVR